MAVEFLTVASQRREVFVFAVRALGQSMLEQFNMTINFTKTMEGVKINEQKLENALEHE